MKCSKCGNECEAVDLLGGEPVNIGIAVSTCCNAEIQKENNMDWKDLEIGDIPEFVEKAVKVQKLIDGNWEDLRGLKSSIVYDVVEPTVSTKYRYRLKPLKSILITADQWKEICSNCLTNHEEEKNMMWDNRKVEIIGDDE